MFKDAIVNIISEGIIDYMLCDQEVDILDDTPYLVRVQKDLVAERLICNQAEDEGMECNEEDEDGGSENNSDLKVNWSKSRFRTSPRCDTLMNNIS